MYNWIPYDHIYREQWNCFAEKYGTPFHKMEWLDILAQSFGYKNNSYLVLDEKNQLAGIFPLMVCRDLTMSKVGLSTPFVNYLNVCCLNEEVENFIFLKLKDLTLTHGARYIELRLKNQEYSLKPVDTNPDNSTFVLPLEGGEEKVMELSTGSNRNHIRKALKSGCFAVSFDYNNLKDFYKVYLATMNRLGSPSPDIVFFEKILTDMKDNSTLLTVLDSQSGKVIGGMFLIFSGNTVYYMWGGCLTEYNKKYVNNFMYWQAVQFGIKNGYSYLDLGRSPVDSGTYKFKKQWGAEPVPLIYYRIKNGNSERSGSFGRDRLSAFVPLWKAVPKFITDYVGKIIIKYILP